MNRHASHVVTPPRGMKMGASRAGGTSGLYGVARRSQSARAASQTDRCVRAVHLTRAIDGADHWPNSAQKQHRKQAGIPVSALDKLIKTSPLNRMNSVYRGQYVFLPLLFISLQLLLRRP